MENRDQRLHLAYVSSDMSYHRKSIYPILIMPLSILMVLNLEGMIRRRRKFSHKVFLALLIAVLPLTGALIIQLFMDVFVFLYI